MIRRSRQDWTAGAIVRVGFLRLRVLGCVPTPGNGAPDQYALSSEDGARFYRFIPHNGLHSCVSAAEAFEVL